MITIFKKRFKIYHWRVSSYSRNRFGLRRDCDVLRRCSSDQFPCITNNFTSVSLFLVYQQRKNSNWKFHFLSTENIDFQNTCQSSYKFVQYSHRIVLTDLKRDLVTIVKHRLLLLYIDANNASVDPLTLESSGYRTMLVNFPRDKFCQRDTFSQKPVLSSILHLSIYAYLATICNKMFCQNSSGKTMNLEFLSFSLNEPFFVIKYDDRAI